MEETKPFCHYKCDRGSRREYAEQAIKPEGIKERTIYQHDKGAITYSKIFRRLAYKSHLVAKRDDHSRSKLLHTLEVSTIATEMADILGLDTALTEAISLGHDLGSYPFGHIGESKIKDKLKKQGWDKTLSHPYLSSNLLSLEYKVSSNVKGRFKRLLDSRCFDDYEIGGHRYIVSISKETLDGIRCHQPKDHRYSNRPQTVEAQLVRVADNFAYITQELDEARSLGVKPEKYKNYSKLECEGERSTLAPSLQKDPTIRQRKDFIWSEINDEAGDYKINPKDLFDKSTGKRLNAMIHWFINYNKKMLVDGKLQMYKSKISHKQIPVLEYPEGLNFCLDYIWSEIIIKEIHNNDNVDRNFKLASQMVSLVYDNILLLSQKLIHERDRFGDRFAEILEWIEPNKEEQADRQIKQAAAIYISEFTDRYLERFFNNLWDFFKDLKRSQPTKP